MYLSRCGRTRTHVLGRNSTTASPHGVFVSLVVSTLRQSLVAFVHCFRLTDSISMLSMYLAVLGCTVVSCLIFYMLYSRQPICNGVVVLTAILSAADSTGGDDLSSFCSETSHARALPQSQQTQHKSDAYNSIMGGRTPYSLHLKKPVWRLALKRVTIIDHTRLQMKFRHIPGYVPT